MKPLIFTQNGKRIATLTPQEGKAGEVFTLGSAANCDVVVSAEYGLAPQIPVSMVGDPALWVPEVYNVAWQGEKSGVIGLNAIRPAIFGGYGEPINPEELTGLYRGLVRRCLKNGFKVQIFSNGAVADNDFARSVLESCEDLKGDSRVSIFLPA